jgi:hypothetical protein
MAIKMEPLITIQLKEYKELMEIKNTFQKAFDENKTIIYHDSYFTGHSGFPVHKFTIVNLDSMTEYLVSEFYELKKINSELNKELNELKEDRKKKSRLSLFKNN